MTINFPFGNIFNNINSSEYEDIIEMNQKKEFDRIIHELSPIYKKISTNQPLSEQEKLDFDRLIEEKSELTDFF